ncbi:MAG: hypothetical protein LBC12_00340 [Nitrososphaerota archaeon]|jgi:hypothetical protein|nr:hypothetical protein [Nitrososphaerota archaeon]
MKQILEKLLHNKCFGKHHLQETTILKGFNRKEHGKLKTTLKQLCKQGLICKKPTQHGMSYYLNTCKMEEIQQILDTS